MKQQRGDHITNKQRTYTKEFRQEAVQFALNSPSVLKAAQDLEIPETTLHTWVQKAKRSGESIDTILKISNPLTQNF